MSDPRKISASEPESVLTDLIADLIGGNESRKADVLASLALLANSPLIRAYEQALRMQRQELLEALVDGQTVHLPDGTVCEKNEVRGVVKGIDLAMMQFNRLASRVKRVTTKEGTA